MTYELIRRSGAFALHLLPSAPDESLKTSLEIVVFRDGAAAAVFDRLLHYSTTVNIRGESYRLKDKKRAGVFSTPAAKSSS